MVIAPLMLGRLVVPRVAYWLDPLKATPAGSVKPSPGKLAPVIRVGPLRVPSFPYPEESAMAVPEVSSSFQ